MSKEVSIASKVAAIRKMQFDLNFFNNDTLDCNTNLTVYMPVYLLRRCTKAVTCALCKRKVRNFDHRCKTLSSPSLQTILEKFETFRDNGKLYRVCPLNKYEFSSRRCLNHLPKDISFIIEHRILYEEIPTPADFSYKDFIRPVNITPARIVEYDCNHD